MLGLVGLFARKARAVNFFVFTSLMMVASKANAFEWPVDKLGEPSDRGFDLEMGASPVHHMIEGLHTHLMYLITGITLFVLGLLLFVIVRFNHRVNKVPSKRTHNVPLEIIWTLIPVAILAYFAVPSLTLLYYQDRTPQAEMTLKVEGHQWYWNYTYPDQGNITFDSRPVWVTPQTTEQEVADTIKDSKVHWLIENGEPRRLLETDNRIVLPVDTNVRVLITGKDVIHAWAVPALAVKRDAIPGRLNETWLRIEKEGVYYGQCSEICGTGHGFMPIVVEAVSKERFAEWVKTDGPRLGMEPAPAATPAAATPAVTTPATK